MCTESGSLYIGSKLLSLCSQIQINFYYPYLQNIITKIKHCTPCNVNMETSMTNMKCRLHQTNIISWAGLTRLSLQQFLPLGSTNYQKMFAPWFKGISLLNKNYLTLFFSAKSDSYDVTGGNWFDHYSSHVISHQYYKIQVSISV